MGQSAQKLPTNGSKYCPPRPTSTAHWNLSFPGSLNLTTSHDQAASAMLASKPGTLPHFLRRRGRRQAEPRGSARQEEEGRRQRRAPQTSRGRRQAGAAAAVLHCQAGAAGLTGRRAVGRGTSADGGTRHARHCTAVGKFLIFVAVIAISSVNMWLREVSLNVFRYFHFYMLII